MRTNASLLRDTTECIEICTAFLSWQRQRARVDGVDSVERASRHRATGVDHPSRQPPRAPRQAHRSSTARNRAINFHDIASRENDRARSSTRDVVNAIAFHPHRRFVSAITRLQISRVPRLISSPCCMRVIRNTFRDAYSPPHVAASRRARRDRRK